MIIDFHPEADKEINESAIFYETHLSGLGDNFVDEIERTINIINAWPEIGSKIDKNFRKILLNKYPYNLIYTIENEFIWIIAVAHHRKKPGYWKNRKNI